MSKETEGKGLFSGLSMDEIEALEKGLEKESVEDEGEEKEGETGGEEDDEKVDISPELLKVLGLDEEEVEDEDEEEEKEGKKTPSREEIKKLSVGGLKDLLEELKDQNLATQEELGSLRRKLSEQGEEEEDPLEGIEEDDTISKAVLQKALAAQKKKNDRVTLMVGATNAKIQEIELKGDPNFADYGELVDKHWDNIRKDERLAEMVASSENPPKAIYLIAKQLERQGKGKEEGDSVKMILQALKKSRESGRGAGKKKGKGKPSSSKAGKKAVGDRVLELAQSGSAKDRAKLLLVKDEDIFAD